MRQLARRPLPHGHTPHRYRGQLPCTGCTDLPWLLGRPALSLLDAGCASARALTLSRMAYGSRAEPRACHPVRRNAMAAAEARHGKRRGSRTNRALHSAHRHQMLTRVKGIMDFCLPTQSGPNFWQLVRLCPVVFHAGQNLLVLLAAVCVNVVRLGPVSGFPCQIWPKFAGPAVVSM